MAGRELFLLSPYRVPAQHSLMLGNEDVLAFLNGFAVLWHPAVLHGATALPTAASPYDHEMPAAGHLYAVPDSPPVSLPDDWEERVRQAGAVTFRTTADRASTLASMLDALKQSSSQEGAQPPPTALLELSAEQVAPFFGLAFGYLHLTALFEAMEHENVLSTDDLHLDIAAAVAALVRGEVDACRDALRAAAERLLAAREVLYPVMIHLLDFTALDEARIAEPLPGARERGLPLNVIAAGAVLEKLAAEQPEQLAEIRTGLEADRLEILGGCYVEREDTLLPLESQLWNLLRGMEVSRQVLGRDIGVFARRRPYAHPQLPLLLTNVGLTRAMLVRLEDVSLPEFHATVVSWPSPDGKQVDAFTRTPYEADNPQTGFHVAHYLHKSIMQDQAATLALLQAR